MQNRVCKHRYSAVDFKLRLDRRHENKLMVISVKQNLTNDYGLLREKMLKSEALLTLSLKASFEANSAPTLHGKSDDGAPVFCVGALFADPLLLLEPSVVWPPSRPNRVSQATREKQRAPEHGR